jgi:triacylglycerol lipase
MMRAKRRTATIVTGIAILVACAGSAPARAAYDTSPPGTNNFSCHPSAAHPRPVVMLEGLGGDSGGWSYMAPRVLDAGYCVFTITYGVDPRIAFFPIVPEGTIPMEQSARELAAFVDRVLTATGATKADIVGHSEGTVMPRYFLERLGGAAKVQHFVALTPLWRGTQIGGIPMLRDFAATLGLADPVVNLVASFCAACTQVLTGSPYLNDLNADGEAIPGIDHTNIVTDKDELVVPYTSGIMRDGGTNIVVQDLCPTDVSEHIGLAFDPVVAQLMLNALDPAHAAPVSC